MRHTHNLLVSYVQSVCNHHVQTCTLACTHGYCVCADKHAQTFERVAIANCWAKLKWKREAQWQREQRNRETEFSAPYCGLTASSGQAVRPFVVSVWMVHVVESMHFSAHITWGETWQAKGRNNTKVQILSWELFFFLHLQIHIQTAHSQYHDFFYPWDISLESQKINK